MSAGIVTVVRSALRPFRRGTTRSGLLTHAAARALALRRPTSHRPIADALCPSPESPIASGAGVSLIDVLHDQRHNSIASAASLAWRHALDVAKGMTCPLRVGAADARPPRHRCGALGRQGRATTVDASRTSPRPLSACVPASGARPRTSYIAPHTVAVARVALRRGRRVALSPSARSRGAERGAELLPHSAQRSSKGAQRCSKGSSKGSRRCSPSPSPPAPRRSTSCRSRSTL